MDITQEIIEQAASGDVVAFEEIYKLTSGFVYNVARGMLHNDQDAQDATQEIFMRIYHSLKRFRFESSLKTWIYRIAVNHTLNICKKNSRTKAHVVTVEDPAILDYVSEKEPKEEIVWNEEQLGQALDLLTEEQRMCVVMRHQQEQSYQKIAEILGMNLNTVRTHLRRARLKLIEIFSSQKEAEHEML